MLSPRRAPPAMVSHLHPHLLNLLLLLATASRPLLRLLNLLLLPAIVPQALPRLLSRLPPTPCKFAQPALQPRMLSVAGRVPDVLVSSFRKAVLMTCRPTQGLLVGRPTSLDYKAICRTAI
ncbi:hypothetical protein BJY52DRAFT_1246754 [Lactarius psammicola]|nr:hypothetical protein BJY52DRAFT_1246754 [Lactarius psammicola]